MADNDDDRGGENCMRVRVRMDVSSPLCRGWMVKLKEGKKGWITYWCGCLDHGEKDYDVGLQQRNSGSIEEY